MLDVSGSAETDGKMGSLIGVEILSSRRSRLRARLCLAEALKLMERPLSTVPESKNAEAWP